MPGHLNGVIKSYRVNQLLMLNETLANQYIDQQDTLSVLFETSDESHTYGHSDSYIAVKIKKDPSLHNKIVDVVIKSGSYGDLEVEQK